jgi:hypothetical protein
LGSVCGWLSFFKDMGCGIGPFRGGMIYDWQENLAILVDCALFMFGLGPRNAKVIK